MRTIVKQNEPRSLSEHKSKFNAAFDNIPTATKDALKDCLLREQGAICCYCMRRISRDTMRVEHWKCQRHNPGLELDYSNLLAACHGNPGQEATCDVRKKDRDLKYNPASFDVESIIAYRKDGTIRSSDMEFDRQLNEVLNLNWSVFKNNRKGTLDACIERVQRWNKRELERLVEQYSRSDASNQLKPFSGVVLFFLRKRLERA